MTTRKKPGAPAGNTNRQKGDTPVTANLSCRCTPELREQVEQAAERDGLSLSDWLVRAVGAAV